MESGTIGQIIFLVILLGCSAFFSSSETALMSLSKTKIRRLLEEKTKGAPRLDRLTNDPEILAGTLLIAKNAAKIGASVISASIATQYLENWGVGTAFGIMLLFILVFGEITPKFLAASNLTGTAIRNAPWVEALSKILGPLYRIAALIASPFIRMLGGKSGVKQTFITEDEVKNMVDVGHEEGVFEVEEKNMLLNVFQFGDSHVKDVMVPRTDIAAVDVKATYDDILELFKQEQYSRMPVYQNTVDNIIGILHVKDMFFFDKKKEHFDIEKNVRKAYYTYETKRIAELFEEMRKKRSQIAVVVDEYGGTAGIVTMQDLVEEIFGDIGDEYDDDTYDIQSIGGGEYIVDGLTKLGQINDILGTDLESEHYETIGGYVSGFLGRFPRKGETLEFDGLKANVLDIYKTRIKRLSLSRMAVTSAESNVQNGKHEDRSGKGSEALNGKPERSNKDSEAFNDMQTNTSAAVGNYEKLRGPREGKSGFELERESRTEWMSIKQKA